MSGVLHSHDWIMHTNCGVDMGVTSDALELASITKEPESL
jgi:hypothetical protein